MATYALTSDQLAKVVPAVPAAFAGPGKGWFYDGAALVTATAAADAALAPIVAEVLAGKTPAVNVTAPASVTNLQFRLALNAAGLREAAEAYIASASQDVKDWWALATVIARDNAMLIAAATAIGKTSADIDALFIDAAKL